MLLMPVKPLAAALFSLVLGATPVLAADITPAAAAKPAPAAQVQLQNVQGGSAALADYHGQVILLDFWASWCGPCRESFPWMNSLQQRFGEQGLKVVAVNLDDDSAAAREFLTQIPAQFTVLLDPEAQLPDTFGVMGMPSSYLIDRQGKLRATHVGFHSQRIPDYENTIKTLLAE